MNGIILIDKPTNMTSYDIIRKLKPQYKGFKIGHAGTLDPLASGLLIVLVGKATKLSSMLMSDRKRYSGTIVFGKLYDSYDIDGKVLKEKVPKVSKEDVYKAFDEFNSKTYNQMPPIYSALKVDGVKAYELARKGLEVNLKPREVIIHELVRTSEYENYEISFNTLVSKQTYIRSLAYDIGRHLGELAALKSLRREKIGPFKVNDAGTIDKHSLITIKEYFKDIIHLKFDNFTTNLVKNGVVLDERQTTVNSDFLVLDENNEAIALYSPSGDGKYRVKVMF